MDTEWCTKLTKKEKAVARHKARLLRKIKQPVRTDFKDENSVRIYCKEQRKSVFATLRMVDLVSGKLDDIDTRDQRRLHKSERVPRSLESEPKSPAGYWKIFI